VKFKNLGDSDSDDDGSALTWVKKARKLRDEKITDTKIAHLQEEAYDSDDTNTATFKRPNNTKSFTTAKIDDGSIVAGLKVLHSMDEITETPTILTLADSKIVSDGVLNDEDELVAVDLMENINAKKNSDIRAGKRKYNIYNDELKDTLLPQYDIDDEEREKLERKQKAIVIGDSGTVKSATDTLQRLTEKLEGIESDSGRVDGTIKLKEATDYYTKEEMDSMFKKPKEMKSKKRKLRKKMTTELINPIETEPVTDLGSRKDREDRQKSQKIEEIVSVLEKRENYQRAIEKAEKDAKLLFEEEEGW